MKTPVLDTIPAWTAQSLAWEKPKFLVVEDDFAFQAIWEKVIRAADPKAVIKWATTERGAEHLMQYQLEADDPFDFVVTDVMLEGKRTGVDLWRRHHQEQTLFLFETGVNPLKLSEMIPERGGELPFVLRKPLNVHQCIKTVKAMLTYRALFTEDGF